MFSERLTPRPTTFDQREDLDRRLLVQYALSRALAESETVEDALPRVLDELGTQLGWQFGAFWLLDEARRWMRCAAVWRSGAYPEFEEATRANSFPRGRGIPGLVWQTGEPVWKSDVGEIDQLPRQQIAQRERLRAVFAFPVHSVLPRGSERDRAVDSPSRRTSTVGVVELYSEHAEPPDEQMLNAATSMGFQLGVFLESRRAHEAERSQRIRNAAVVEVALDCIITIDHDGLILEWNPAAERTFGYPRNAVIGRQLAETIIPPHFREAHYSGFARYRQTGEAHLLGTRIEVEGMRADGSIIPIELTITRIPLPGPPVFTAYLRELTERRRLEATQQLLLRVSNVLLSSLESERMLCNLSKVVVPAFADWYTVDVVEPDGSIRRLETEHRDPSKREAAHALAARYANRPESQFGARAVIRSGRSQLVTTVTDDILSNIAQDAQHLRLVRGLGVRSFIVVPLRGRDAILGAMTFVSAESDRRFDKHDLEVAEELAMRAAQAIDNARLFADVEEGRRLLEEQATELEAQAAELEVVAAELEHSNNGLRAANEDLAERTKDAERARFDAEDARREADEANRAKSDFLAAMSHELRTPLNAIIGYAQLLDVGIHGPVNAEQHADLGRIERSSQHLLGLITDILNYAKVESGRLEYDIVATRLDQSLTAVEELVAPLAAAKRITYRLRTACPGVRVCADAEKLRQILVNLLSNAIRYTTEGGSVELCCSAPDKDVLIDVVDTGVGIPADKLEAIFEPFVQVDRTYAGQRQGTGLGLAISRDLARGMRGDLTVRSQLGKGSVFTVRLPKA
ncbi:MAG TPA: ATP-binding protein [Gemmatimonadaceae bacterium]|jgi:PAS domain S-box-containing protein